LRHGLYGQRLTGAGPNRWLWPGAARFLCRAQQTQASLGPRALPQCPAQPGGRQAQSLPGGGGSQNLDLARSAIAVAADPDVLINEAGKMLNGVQKGLNLQLHGWSLGLFGSIDFDTDCHSPRPAFFHPARAFLFRDLLIACFCGLGDRALQECNPSTKPSVDCSDRIPSGPRKNSDRISTPKDAIASHGQSEKLISYCRPSGR
jgi:hypothetical protein